MTQGLLSGLLASFSLFIILQYLYAKVSELKVLSDVSDMLLIFLALIFLGVVIGLFSSYRAVNKYLKLSLDELY